MIFTNLHAATNTWNTVGKAKEKGLFDFDFIKWMAWTYPTASFFIFIALCITVMYFWEKKDPGGNPRKAAKQFLHRSPGSDEQRCWIRDYTEQQKNAGF